MNLPSTHVHITEREVAHRWPDGRYDDSAWEDCAFCSAVEWIRLTKMPSVPATHTEAEAVRSDAGLGPAGGATQQQVRNGLMNRYKFNGRLVYGAAAIWSALSPGNAGSVQGSYGVWPDGSHWRRWDPAFKGIHQATALRLDAQDRVWWCDPLAPTNVGYNGEWMPKADFLKYINGYTAGGAIVAAMLPVGGQMNVVKDVTRFAAPRHASIKNTGHVSGYDGTSSVEKKGTSFNAGSGFAIVAVVTITGSDAPPAGEYVEASHDTSGPNSGGYFAGLYVPLSEVNATVTPDGGHSDQELADAYTKGFGDAKTKSEAAVSGIQP